MDITFTFYDITQYGNITIMHFLLNIHKFKIYILWLIVIQSNLLVNIVFILF